MRIAVPKEIRDGEKRVALVPDIISKLTRLGFDVVIESGAGVHSQATDADYISAGATISKGEVLSAADAVLSVQPLTPVQMATLKKGAVTISFMSPVTAVDSMVGCCPTTDVEESEKRILGVAAAAETGAASR